ncbi:MAG: penicillin-insensitive murein endopeptidase [Bacteriovorax sp.]|nr:penicillin-insensitive murein endopeptidase [Bacteriovorax sp.]
MKNLFSINKNKTYVLIATFFLIISCSHQLPDFTSRLSSRLPNDKKTEAIGEYSLGCLQGAQTFNGNELGLLLSQMKRGRYWGHPALIKLLTNAGEEFNKSHKKIILGDLSQSRGGPTLTGHNSHQTGLDVDVWFKILTDKDQPSLRALETEDMKPISELGDDQIKLIKFFASDSSVERIFINPTFKKRLCSDNGALKLTSEEQHKMRAWWGHDDHIHVRLKCPSDSPSCESQKPVPEGTGCGEELNWWFTDDAKVTDSSWEDLKSAYLDKVKKLPAQCSFYLETL